MKIKTSLSLKEETLNKIKALAADDDRSVSYLLERIADYVADGTLQLPNKSKKEYPVAMRGMSLAGA